jgi:hypothetical protein
MKQSNSFRKICKYLQIEGSAWLATQLEILTYTYCQLVRYNIRKTEQYNW